MLRPLHLRRSWLFVGAANEEDIQASFASNADVCILDFEDFCPPNKRSKARKMLPEILKKWSQLGKVTAVRINPLETEDGKKDLEATIFKNINTILLSKVENKQQVDLFIKEKIKYEKKIKKKYNSIEFIPNIESALGVENLKDILSSNSCVGALIASEDMAFSLGLNDNRENKMLDFVRKKLHLACRAYGKLTIDMPYTWDNLSELINELNHIKKLGIIAKSTIKASHCKVINKHLTPTKEEVIRCKKIVNKFNKALENNKNQIFYNNHYLELPAFYSAKRIIKRHKELGEYEKIKL
ncbi:MAG: hypothetical protein CMJ13_03995 [Pelagibacterales bacterium]|nr:hypothetical protein [Pelagibacterales bacterium]